MPSTLDGLFPKPRKIAPPQHCVLYVMETTNPSCREGVSPRVQSSNMSTAVCLLAHRRRGEIRVFLSFFLEFFFFLFRQQATLDACFYAISERNAARKNRKKSQNPRFFSLGGFFLWRRFPRDSSFLAATGISKKRPP